MTHRKRRLEFTLSPIYSKKHNIRYIFTDIYNPLNRLDNSYNFNNKLQRYSVVHTALSYCFRLDFSFVADLYVDLFLFLLSLLFICVYFYLFFIHYNFNFGGLDIVYVARKVSSARESFRLW